MSFVALIAITLATRAAYQSIGLTKKAVAVVTAFGADPTTIRTATRDFQVSIFLRGRVAGPGRTEAQVAAALRSAVALMAASATQASSYGVAATGTHVLRWGAIVDVERKRIGSATNILVVDGVITRIDSGLSADAATVVDFSDQYRMPGLMVMHVHLFVDSSTGMIAQNLLNKSKGALHVQVVA